MGQVFIPLWCCSIGIGTAGAGSVNSWRCRRVPSCKPCSTVSWSRCSYLKSVFYRVSSFVEFLDLTWRVLVRSAPASKMLLCMFAFFLALLPVLLQLYTGEWQGNVGYIYTSSLHQTSYTLLLVGWPVCTSSVGSDILEGSSFSPFILDFCKTWTLVVSISVSSYCFLDALISERSRVMCMFNKPQER